MQSSELKMHQNNLSYVLVGKAIVFNINVTSEVLSEQSGFNLGSFGGAVGQRAYQTMK